MRPVFLLSRYVILVGFVTQKYSSKLEISRTNLPNPKTKKILNVLTRGSTIVVMKAVQSRIGIQLAQIAPEQHWIVDVIDTTHREKESNSRASTDSDKNLVG